MLLCNQDANISAVAQAAPNAEMIYLASHGSFNERYPGLSFIELAGGVLRAYDVLGMHLKATTVVLNACETGIGKLSGSDVMGFVRAFLAAGARSVLATHWPVEDESTAKLMVAFVKELQVGTNFSPTNALNSAQLSFVKSKDASGVPAVIAHPFFWGAWSVFGRDS